MSSKTAMYLVKRIAFALITIIAVITITFFVMNAVPGNPFISEKTQNEAQIEALNRKYGLDKPLIVQWLNYLKGALVLDFGQSIKNPGENVTDIILTFFKVSAPIGIIAACIAIVVGIIFGVLAAVNHGKIWDKLIMFISTAMVAVPSFIIAVILLYFLCVKVRVFPSNFGLSDDPSKYILPIITLALYPTAYIIRLTRSSTLDVLGADYIRTAKAKGVSPAKVLFKHALRNSLTPVITYAGPMIAFILTGSLVVEQTFTIPGLGSKFIKCIQESDYPLIMGTTVFLSIIVVIMLLISDILYKVANPRIDLE